MILLLLLAMLCPIAARAQTTVPEWRAHTPLPTALTGHRSLLLSTGDVLVAGGIAPNGQATTTSLIYSASTGTFRTTLNALSEGRAYHELVAVPLAGGGSRVFAIGGYGGSAGAYRGLASVEVLEYDAPQSNWRWRRIGDLHAARGGLAATWDGGNYIIVSGGRSQITGAPGSGTRSAAADRIDLNTLQVQAIGDMATPRAEHTLARVIDAQGKNLVITAGGESTLPTTATELLAGTLWDPRANPPLIYRSWGVGLGDITGTGRTFGGFDQAGVPSNRCEWYDVKSGWRFAPRMESERGRFAATLIAGPVDSSTAYLIVAGQGIAGPLAKTEVFSLPDNTNTNGLWTPFAPLSSAGAEREVAITGQNLALVTGGTNGAGQISGTEIFQPFRINDPTFAPEETGRLSDSIPVTIRNEWYLPVRARNLRIAGSAEFIFYGDTTTMVIPPSGQRTIFVRFRPAAAGERRGLLLLDVGSIVDTVTLRGTGVESSIGVVTAGISFDSVLVKSSRQICFPAIRNNGTEPATIDSVVLTPAGAYRLISPIGRVTIQPGDTLQVCAEFLPQERGSAIASIGVHLAGRIFPIAVDGFGIRRYATVTGNGLCDTVVDVPGTPYSAFVTLHNTGDMPVTITGANFNASTAGLFALADPTILPLTLQPGASLPVELRFTPQREATEHATVEFVNNGDTVTIAPLCFVVRSRFLSSSLPEIDFGTPCAGDTVVRSVVLENPGGFDTVRLDGVGIVDPSGSVVVDQISPTELAPHQYVTVTARYMPRIAGSFSGTITATGSFGSVSLPVSGKALPGLRFSPDSLSTSPGATVVIPVEIGGTAGAPVSSVRLRMSYNRTLLYPIRPVGLAGAVPLNVAASRLAINAPGEATIDLAWNGALVADGPAFGIECEVLRGDATSTPVTLGGAGGGEFCILPGSAEIAVACPCGGESGLIRAEGAGFLRVVGSPNGGTLNLDVDSPREGMLDIQLFNVLGGMILRGEPVYHISGRGNVALPLGAIPDGLYFVRATIGHEQIDQQPVLIIGR